MRTDADSGKTETMKRKDDDHRSGRPERPSTTIVPDGDLDAVAAADGRQSRAARTERPFIDPETFDAKRVMAPGGDLDAIHLNAGIAAADRQRGGPVGPAVSASPHPDGDGNEMTIRKSGPFVDSGLEEDSGREPRFRAAPARGRVMAEAPEDARDFRFRDGSDEPFSATPDDFRDRGAQAAVRSRVSPTITGGRISSETPPSGVPEPSDARHAGDRREPARAPVVESAPQHGPKEASAACIDVSTAQLEEVVGRIMERVFVEKIEAMLQAVLEKAVDRELERFRRKTTD
jgi:hypothetical protein